MLRGAVSVLQGTRRATPPYSCHDCRLYVVTSFDDENDAVVRFEAEEPPHL